MAIGVGIIGASADRGWAADAHVPALRALSQYRLAAISTSRRESAARSAAAFGVALAFDNHEDLLGRPDVELSVVAVKVPHHFELVSAALNAGKAVYCEWPLANGLREAQALANLPRDSGVVARVGLQARSSPAINYVRALVADGYVGRVLSSSIVASGLNWGPEALRCYAYLHDKKNGASMLTIPFGHTTDAFCWSLGEFAELSATFATQRPEVRVSDDGTVCRSNIADQVSVTGVLESGAVASIHFHGGLSRAIGFLWEIHGTEGDLLIEGPNGHVQMMPLEVKGGRGDQPRVLELPIPSAYRWTPPGAPDGFPFNLAQAYMRLAGDLTGGTETIPDFRSRRRATSHDRRDCQGGRERRAPEL